MENSNKTSQSRTLNIISNRRIKIERYRCPFCRNICNKRIPPSFKTSWSAIWHLSHNHKDEAGLDVFEIRVPEISFIKTLAMELGLAPRENKNELWISDPDGIQILIKSA